MSEKRYRAMKYIRLSYADDTSGESNSVTNQRKLLDSFIENHPDIEAVGEKVEACDIIEPNPGSLATGGFRAIWSKIYYAQGLIPRPLKSRT